MNEIFDAVEKLESGNYIYACVNFDFVESNYLHEKLEEEDVGEVYIQSKYDNFETIWEHAKSGEVVSKDVFRILYNLGKLRIVTCAGAAIPGQKFIPGGLVRTMFEYVLSTCYLGEGSLGLSPTTDKPITSNIRRADIDRSEEYRYTIEKLANHCELVVKGNGNHVLVHNKYKQPILLHSYEIEELKSLKYTDVRENDKNQTCISFKDWFIKSVTDRYEDLEDGEALRFFLTPDEYGEYPDMGPVYVPYDELVNEEFNNPVCVENSEQL